MSIWFVLQKTILVLLLPPSGVFLILLAGVLVYKKSDKRTGVKIIVSGIVLLYLLSTSFVSNLLIRPIENDHPPFAGTDEEPLAIIVLTSGVKDLSDLGLAPQPSSASVARLIEGMALTKKYPGVPLVICGGSGDPAKPDLSEAKALAAMAVSAGIPEKDIMIEDSSVNTREGAINARHLLEGKKGKVLLVTSAYHMDRSKRFFEKASFSVIPAPTDYRGEPFRLSLSSLIPSAEHLYRSSTALYEYLCRIRYAFVI